MSEIKTWYGFLICGWDMKFFDAIGVVTCFTCLIPKIYIFDCPHGFAFLGADPSTN